MKDIMGKLETMTCKCGGEVSLIRTINRKDHKWRRYECYDCAQRFSTSTTTTYKDGQKIITEQIL